MTFSVGTGKQSGYVVFAGQKIPLERPRVRTREGQEVELESYRQWQQDGKLQRAVREGVVAGLSTRHHYANELHRGKIRTGSSSNARVRRGSSAAGCCWAGVAQLVERVIRNDEVASSILAPGSSFLLEYGTNLVRPIRNRS
jgi:hypothetical protein